MITWLEGMETEYLLDSKFLVSFDFDFASFFKSLLLDKSHLSKCHDYWLSAVNGAAAHHLVHLAKNFIVVQRP